MGLQFDEHMRRALREIFADRASNVPVFTKAAMVHPHRADWGLRALLPPDWTDAEMRAALKRSIVEFLDAGRAPKMNRMRGDAQMGYDDAVFFEFRLDVVGVRLYVKVLFEDDDPDDPCATVINVHRA